jgi:hypothetical protein
MTVLIQKHRSHPIWKFYDDQKMFLGQILGSNKETMSALAKGLAPFLTGGTVAGYKKETQDDGSMNIINIANNKRVANFEKEFALIADAIKADK